MENKGEFVLEGFSRWWLEKVWILVMLIILAALMSGFLFYMNPNIGGDALQYHSAFHNFIQGNRWHIYDGSWARVDPGYGMLSYVFFLFIRDIEISGMLVSVVAYLLMIPVMFSAVDFIFGKRTALLASFLITFYPTLISYSYINLTDVVFTFFLLLGFLLYTRVLLGKHTPVASQNFGECRTGCQPVLRYAPSFSRRYHTPAKNALLGLVLGVAYLIRAAEGLMVAGLALAGLLIIGMVDWSREEKPPRSFGSLAKKHIFPPGVAIFVFLLISLPYVLLIRDQAGVWSFTARIKPVTTASQAATGASVSQAASSPTADGEAESLSPPATPLPAAAQQPRFLGAIEAYSPNLKNLAAKTSKMLVLFWEMNSHALLPLGILGAVYPFLGDRKLFAKVSITSFERRILLALGVFSSPAIIHFLVSALHSNRWMLQYSAYILIGIAFLTIRFLERFLESVGSKRFDLGVVLVCLITLAASWVAGSPTLVEVFTTPHAHLGLRSAGLWLHDNVQDPGNLNILAPKKGAVALFYASGKSFSMGESTNATMPLEDISALLEGGDADYLLLDNHYVQNFGALKPLWDNPALGADYGLDLLFSDPRGLFQIYESSASP